MLEAQHNKIRMQFFSENKIYENRYVFKFNPFNVLANAALRQSCCCRIYTSVESLAFWLQGVLDVVPTL
jgi:hypothetical protein